MGCGGGGDVLSGTVATQGEIVPFQPGRPVPPANTSTTAAAPPTPTPGPTSTNCLTHLPSGSVIGTAALPDGSGYYEVDSAGDVSAFGGATCYGAMTGTPLNRPIVGMTVDPATGGYWLVATDGGIFRLSRSVPRLHRQSPPQSAGRGHDGHSGRRRLHLQCPLLR